MRCLPLLILAAGALPAVPADDPAAERPIDKAAVATIDLKGYPDWIEVAFGSVWVSNPGLGSVQRIDPVTNKVIAEVKVTRPAAAMAAGFGSVRAASRGA